MQEQGKKTLIGAFVVGALALGVGGVVAFGGTDLFAEKDRFVVYFEGFVDGLEPGSPIMFRGMRIGEVESLHLVLGPNETPLVEVIFDLRRRDIARQAGMNQLPDAKSALDHWVKRGMRAQLGTVSLLTGQLKIDLDLVAQGPMKLYGLRQDLPEVPAIASSRERISEAIQSIPYETLAQSLTEIITGIRDLVKSPEIEKTWDDLNRTIETFDRVLASLEQRLPKILDGLQGSVEEAGATLRNANGKLDDLSGRIGPTIDDLRATITELRAKSGTTLDETNGTLREMRTTLAKLDAEIQPTSASLRSTLDEARAAMAQLADASAPGAPMMLEMRRALEKLSKTLDAFAALASTLERQPESILKGKSGG
ncbi:MAG: MCE family protein [Planctomycetes bacterium]|nr:MCE family protein [Planctomycetota bacterium]